MLTCKDVSHLVSTSQERPLGFRERLGLRVHLWMCANCRRFQRQIDLLRLALRKLATEADADPHAPALSAEARQRIREALAERRANTP